MERKVKKPCGLHCIKIKNLSITLGGNNIIEDVNMHIHCGSLLAVVGKNGAGKTTLIRGILGDVPYQGTIEFRDMQDETLQDLTIGYVPQQLNIDPNTPTSVYDLIASFDSAVPICLWRSKKEAARIKAQLDIFGAGDLLDHQVCKLSGGQLQRVLLALATIREPKLLILDEPVSGIDKMGMEQFYQQIGMLKKEFDMAVILISHDLEYVARYADEVILLNKTVQKSGTVREVYESPEFISAFGRVAGRKEDAAV